MTFNFTRVIHLTLMTAVFFIGFSCNKDVVVINQVQTRGGLALTFDDYSVDNWYSYLPMLDSFGVRATFYISNYNKLTAAQKNKLHDFESHGNEIAFHSTTHVDFLKYAESNSCDKLLKEEVANGMQLMINDGFHPTTFAYPYGKHNEILDKLLLKSFKNVRALNGTAGFARSLAPLQGNKILYGLGIDESSNRDLSRIKGLLSLAKQRNQCAILVVHNIERTDINLQVPLWKLREILSKVRSLDLKFYTVSEISE